MYHMSFMYKYIYRAMERPFHLSNSFCYFVLLLHFPFKLCNSSAYLEYFVDFILPSLFLSLVYRAFRFVCLLLLFVVTCLLKAMRPFRWRPEPSYLYKDFYNICFVFVVVIQSIHLSCTVCFAFENNLFTLKCCQRRHKI